MTDPYLKTPEYSAALKRIADFASLAGPLGVAGPGAMSVGVVAPPFAVALAVTMVAAEILRERSQVENDVTTLIEKADRLQREVAGFQSHAVELARLAKLLQAPGGMTEMQAENIRMGAAFGSPPTQRVRELQSTLARMDNEIEAFQIAANRLAAAAARYRDAATKLQSARDTSKRRLTESLRDWEVVEKRLLHKR